MYSLKEAAEAVGRGKPALLKAIKSGRVSAQKDEFGQWRIDPAELHRVYPPVAAVSAGTGEELVAGERGEPGKVSEVSGEVEALREVIADLRGERDRLLALLEVQAGAVKLLTDQRKPEPERRRWWPWGRAKTEG